MNKPRSSLFSHLWLALALAILPALAAQETPPAPIAPEKPAAPAAAVESIAPAPVAEETAALQASPPADDTLRELDATPEPKAKEKSKRSRQRASTGHDDRPPFGSHRVPAGQTQREVVSLFGSSTVDGTVTDAAVSIMGNTTVNGSVGDAAVSVMGNTTINGTVGDVAVSVFGTTTVNGKVKGSVVAVLGNVVLGPNAEVGEEVVAVLGKVTRADTSVVMGGVQQIGGFGPFGDFSWLRAWVTKCLFLGRPLGFGEHLGWTWMVAGGFLLFYLLLALLFPRAIDRSVEVLEQRPGKTLLAALLAALLAPILFVLLAITGIGIVLIPFLAAAMFLGALFGRAAVCAWFGRRVTALFGDGAMRHATVEVLFGGVIVALLYTVPFLGGLLWKLFGILGLGMVVYALILSIRGDRPAAPAPGAPPPQGAFGAALPIVPPPVVEPGAANAGFGAATPPVYGAPIGSGPMPHVISAATLPRAGFWIRTAASLLDLFIIGLATGFLGSVIHLNGPGFLFVAMATYSAVMWKHKGTTIGGVICGLKVVRLDDRPLDWSVSIIRALTAFLSFCVAGLGFIWVAFDDDKQSWHDKVAGTTIVKVPKGTSLL